MQYSSSVNLEYSIFKKQVSLFLLAFPMSYAICGLYFNHFTKYIYYIYLGSIFILCLVLIAGKTAMGATRWINVFGMNVQPSEIIKIIVILTLARFLSYAKYHPLNVISYFLIPVLIVLAPTILVLMQPNLGTAFIIILIGGTMILTLFKHVKYILICACLVFCSIPLVWQFGLHDYQKQRVMTFFDPEKDSKGSGYNIIQSKIAIGSGHITGNGYLMGGQSKLNFLPEQHTDFVFAIFAEEFGFILTALLLIAYLILIIIIYYYSANIFNLENKIILVGIASLFFWHIFINIGMSMDILPVVGVPLPFISYGRSFFITNILCMNILFRIIK